MTQVLEFGSKKGAALVWAVILATGAACAQAPARGPAPGPGTTVSGTVASKPPGFGPTCEVSQKAFTPALVGVRPVDPPAKDADFTNSGALDKFLSAGGHSLAMKDSGECFDFDHVVSGGSQMGMRSREACARMWNSCDRGPTLEVDVARCMLPCRLLNDPPLEACEKACAVDGTSCRLLAYRHLMGQGTPRNESEAFRLLEKSCAAGDQLACSKLGSALLAGEGVAKDERRGVALLSGACDARLGLACELLGDAHAEGQGVPQDDAAAVELYRKACGAGGQEGDGSGGCTKLGRMYRAGRGVRADTCLAHGAFGLACARNEPEGCAEFSEAYLLGTVVEKDPARWAELNQRSCEKKERAGCMHLALGGGVVGSGSDLKLLGALQGRVCSSDEDDSGACAALRVGLKCPEVSKSMCAAAAYVFLAMNQTNDFIPFELLRQTCERSDLAACHFLGLLHRDSRGVLHDPGRAEDIFRRECEKGDGDGCSGLAQMCERGDGVSKNLERALALHEKACAAGTAASCVSAGFHYGTPTAATKDDLTRAVTFYRRACEDLNDATGCRNLIVALGKLEPVSADTPDIMKTRERACALGDLDNCSTVALALRRGKVEPTERERSSRLFLAGCMNAQESRPGDCLAYGEMVVAGTVPAAEGKGSDWAFAEAFRKAQKGCDGTAVENCSTLGILYELGRGTPKDSVRAFAAYTRDCDRGLCANVGYAYAVGVGAVRDERRALEVFRESCATRPGDYACANQGFMQLLGLGGAQSRPKALALLRAAKSSIVNGLIDSCDSGCGRDCSILGAILQARGQKAEAAEKLRRGCTLGDDRACEHRVR